MNMKTLVRLIRLQKVALALTLQGAFRSFYKLSFACSAASHGLMGLLAGQAISLEQIRAQHAPGSRDTEILTAWLQLGIRLGEIKHTRQGYRLHGLSKKLAMPHNDDYLALTQEVVGIHNPIILRAPAQMKNPDKWQFRDHDGPLIARSSRTLEPFVLEAIERTFPLSGATRLLEVGCGSAVYLRYAARMNPKLTGVGLELQEDVAQLAAVNISAWGLADRITIACRDIRDWTFEERFDCATLHNNIYYFDVIQRVPVLKRLHDLLSPGGFILVTTGCQNGNSIIAALNLLCTTTEGYARLPGVDEMETHLRDAGFVEVKSMSLIPGDSYHAFVGRRV